MFLRKLVGKRRFWCYKVSKVAEVSHEMLVLMLPRVSSRVSDFPVASPCLWGKLQNLSFSKVSKQVVMSFCVAGMALSVWHSNLFYTVSKILLCGWLNNALHTLHSTLYTPHSTLHTLHSTLHTLHSTTLYTLHAPHSSLHTLHSTLLALHPTLYTLHFTLYTPHCTLYTPHSTLYTLHYFPLHAPHSTLYNSTLYTLHSKL